MDYTIKDMIELIAQTVLYDEALCGYVTDPIKKIASKNDQLSELHYLQCLQELSRIHKYRNNVLQVMDNIINNTLDCIIFHGERQSYILQDTNPNEIKFLRQERTDALNSIKSFVSSKHLLPDLIPPFHVYDAFMDMVDSLSVYPKANFNNSWLRIVNYYLGNCPFEVSNDLSNSVSQKNISSLCACYNKIIQFEKERKENAPDS